MVTKWFRSIEVTQSCLIFLYVAQCVPGITVQRCDTSQDVQSKGREDRLVNVNLMKPFPWLQTPTVLTHQLTGWIVWSKNEPVGPAVCKCNEFVLLWQLVKHQSHPDTKQITDTLFFFLSLFIWSWNYLHYGLSLKCKLIFVFVVNASAKFVRQKSYRLRSSSYWSLQVEIYFLLLGSTHCFQQVLSAFLICVGVKCQISRKSFVLLLILVNPVGFCSFH